MATLGTEPQVVTSAYWLLRRQGEALSGIQVFYTRAPAIVEARRSLEKAQKRFALPEMQFHLLGEEAGRPLDDVLTQEDVQAAFTILYNRLYTLKSQGHRVHFLIAGGRKPLALYGMAAAQLLFDEEDRLWHLYSGPDFLHSRRMIPRAEDDVHLIPIPLIPWHCMLPAATLFEPMTDPWLAVDQARQMGLRTRMHQARHFVEENLTPAERRVVILLVREGLSDREIAQRLHLSPRTVERHLGSVYQKAAAFWGLKRVNRSQLVALLHLYLAASPKFREIPHDGGWSQD